MKKLSGDHNLHNSVGFKAILKAKREMSSSEWDRFTKAVGAFADGPPGAFLTLPDYIEVVLVNAVEVEGERPAENP